MNAAVILTDIEGTTSSIDFVHTVLFPYASRQLPAYVRENQDRPEVAGILADARQEAQEPDAGVERLIDVMQQWIRADKKVTPLKALQGHIWRHGYASGDFTGHMYADAVNYLQAWAQAGIPLYVYSSGSVAAQQLLFANSDAGDLTPLFAGYFDTRIGHKRDSQAYADIAAEIGTAAEKILFLSDVAAELDAAATAGMQTVQLVRDDKVIAGSHRIAHDFSEIDV
jgi:enolase-phosphatase E1